jgi:hypothetical protein
MYHDYSKIYPSSMIVDWHTTDNFITAYCLTRALETIRQACNESLRCGFALKSTSTLFWANQKWLLLFHVSSRRNALARVSNWLMKTLRSDTTSILIIRHGDTLLQNIQGYLATCPFYECKTSLYFFHISKYPRLTIQTSHCLFLKLILVNRE